MKRKKLIAIITLILTIILCFLVYKNVSIEKNKEDKYQEYTPQEEISEEQNRQTKVTLYFQNIETGETQSDEQQAGTTEEDNLDEAEANKENDLKEQEDNVELEQEEEKLIGTDENGEV